MKLSGSLLLLLTCAILGNGQDSVSFLEPNCGASNGMLRIIGGEPANKNGNPWMAFVSSTVNCGGSLITDRFVLSAAHCITGNPTTVTLGEYDRSSSSENAIQVPVDLQIPHGDYKDDSKDIKYDIGLFRLARRVEYTDFIRPICLPTNHDFLAETTHLNATGWGRTEYGVQSDVLKTTTLTKLDRSTCFYTYWQVVDNSQICARGFNSSTCSGDSGGPISVVRPIGGRNRVIQLGIVSYGSELCHTAGVYTNVMHYMDWIQSAIQQAGGVQTTTPAPTQRPNRVIDNNFNNMNYYTRYYPTTPAPTQRPNRIIDNNSNNLNYYIRYLPAGFYYNGHNIVYHPGGYVVYVN